MCGQALLRRSRLSIEECYGQASSAGLRTTSDGHIYNLAPFARGIRRARNLTWHYVDIA